MLNDINDKILNAKKMGDKFTSNSLVMVKSELLNNQKTEKPKEDEEVVRSYVKKLNKSLEAFKGTNQYDDLVREYELVKGLLPAEVSEEDIRFVVNKYVLDNPEEKNMGKVMGSMKNIFKNSPVDGALLSRVVKEVLAN
jgi:uncharacterized protein YqeY